MTHPDGNKWFKKTWLSNADDLFPKLYITYPKATEIIGEIVDDDEICKVSRKSVIFVKIKNKIIVSFPGVATSGNSNIAVAKADFIANQLNILTKDCEQDKVSMFRQIENVAINAKFSIRQNRRHRIRLIIENANLVIYDENYYVKQFLVKSSDWFGYDI